MIRGITTPRWRRTRRLALVGLRGPTRRGGRARQAARHAKEGFGFVAEGPLAHGFNVAVAGYTLAPEATMDDIVHQARAALRWLHQHLATLGGGPARLHASGWSAGGHLAAMLMDDPLVAGGLANSGLFDLEPIRLSYLNEKLCLDAAQARRNSPMLNLPVRTAKFISPMAWTRLAAVSFQSRLQYLSLNKNETAVGRVVLDCNSVRSVLQRASATCVPPCPRGGLGCRRFLS